MADWNTPLPKDAVEGDEGHPDSHNQLKANVKEIRDLVDSGALNGKDGKNGTTPTVDNISGATDTGKAVLKAENAAAARTAIGAGTSNLKLGTDASSALKGDYKPAWADVTGKPTIPSISGLAKQSDLDAAVARIKALEDAATPPAEG
jgi:hypothetical protein